MFVCRLIFEAYAERIKASNLREKATELKSFFNKVADLNARIFIKKRLQQKRLPVSIANL